MDADSELKTCLVTGASRGIGEAIARVLADAGFRIVVHFGHNRALAEAVAKDLPGDGHIVVGGVLDEPGAAGSLIGEVVDRVGRLDVLVNNAGIYEPHPPLVTDAADWRRQWEQTLAVNLLAPATLCHGAAKVMAAHGGGRIINIGSRGAFRGEPDCPAYAASKAGLHAMSQSLAVALACEGILVFAIAPGFVETDMAKPMLEGEEGAGIRAQSPFGRVARPEEVAETVRFLATTDAEFLSGAIVDLNGASYLRN